MIVMSLSSIYRLIAHAQEISPYEEDIFIAAKQVSQYVLGTQYLEIGEKYTYVDFDQQEMTFELHNHRLVKTPGFEILLSDIDSLRFEQEDQLIYMLLERDNQEYRFLINVAREKTDAPEEPEENFEQ